MTGFEGKIYVALTRQSTVGLLFLAAVTLYAIWSLLGGFTTDYTPDGVLIPDAGADMASGLTAHLVNLGAATISVLFLWMLNRWYYITHSYCRIFIGLFLLGIACVPAIWGYMSSGLVMCAVLLFCVIMLYSLYQRPSGTRRIFLVFFMLSTGGLFDFAYIGFAVPMLLACGQMRCLSIRAVLAAGIGLITPLWIGLGFGWITPDALCYPTVSLPTLAIIEQMTIPLQVLLASVIIITAVLTIVNSITIYGHNAKTRANNGVLALLSLWAVLASVVDFDHVLSYLPVLLALMAVQVSLCMSLRKQGRGYIAVALSILLFASCAVWQIILL